MMLSRAYEPEAFTPVRETEPGIIDPIDEVTFELKDPELQFIPTAEGFYDYIKNQYIYQYKDHLGNVRLSFARNKQTQALEITDANDYYPFGMNHLKTGNAFFGQGSYKNYKYNGKELQETGMYDYGARFYMPDIGRWGVIDPAAELSRRWSTYTYAYNNPIRFIDPDGRFAIPPDDYIDASTGKYLGSDGAATTNIRTIYRNDWNDITSENGGSTSAAATAALQKNSGIVTVNTAQIGSDINSANNETIADQTKERQVWIGIEVTRGDIPTAQVTSVRGPDGVDGKTTTSITSLTDKSGATVKKTFDGTKLLPVAQAHTHNTSQNPSLVNIPGTSAMDKATSNSFNIPVYSIDSYTGAQTNGNAIHRVMPNGTQTNNVGTTSNQT